MLKLPQNPWEGEPLYNEIKSVEHNPRRAQTPSRKVMVGGAPNQEVFNKQIEELNILWRNGNYYLTVGEVAGALVAFSNYAVYTRVVVMDYGDSSTTSSATSTTVVGRPSFPLPEGGLEGAKGVSNPREALTKTMQLALGYVETLQAKLSAITRGEEKGKDIEDAELCIKQTQDIIVQFKGKDCITFDDIIGLGKEKKAIKDSFVRPIIYKRLYGKLAKGMLLYGPPGTGKTLLAKASATQLQLENDNVRLVFLAPTGASLKGKYVGETEKNILRAFRCASVIAENAETKCISEDGKERQYLAVLFIDEFDSIAGDRSTDTTGLVANSVNTLLQVIDGVISFPNVILVAATNYPWNLDAAILRRFDQQLLLDYPSFEMVRDICNKTIREHYFQPYWEAIEKKSTKIFEPKDPCKFTCGDAGATEQLNELVKPFSSFDYDFKLKNIDFQALCDQLYAERYSNSDVVKVINLAIRQAASKSLKYPFIDGNLLFPGETSKEEKTLKNRWISVLTKQKDKTQLEKLTESLINLDYTDYTPIYLEKTAYEENGFLKAIIYKDKIYYNTKLLVDLPTDFYLEDAEITDFFMTRENAKAIRDRRNIDVEATIIFSKDMKLSNVVPPDKLHFGNICRILEQFTRDPEKLVLETPIESILLDISKATAKLAIREAPKGEVKTSEVLINGVNIFFQKQIGALSCGRYAMNNVLGGEYYLKTGAKPKIKEDLNTPPSPVNQFGLKQLMDLLNEKFKAIEVDTTEGKKPIFSEGENLFQWRESEHYEIQFILAAMDVAGFLKQAEISGFPMEPSKKKHAWDTLINNDYLTNKKLILLYPDGAGHYISYKQERTKTGGIFYVRLDSLKETPTKIDNLAQLEKDIFSIDNFYLLILRPKDEEEKKEQPPDITFGKIVTSLTTPELNEKREELFDKIKKLPGNDTKIETGSTKGSKPTAAEFASSIIDDIGRNLLEGKEYLNFLNFLIKEKPLGLDLTQSKRTIEDAIYILFKQFLSGKDVSTGATGNKDGSTSSSTLSTGATGNKDGSSSPTPALDALKIFLIENLTIYNEGDIARENGLDVANTKLTELFKRKAEAEEKEKNSKEKKEIIEKAKKLHVDTVNSIGNDKTLVTKAGSEYAGGGITEDTKQKMLKFLRFYIQKEPTNWEFSSSSINSIKYLLGPSKKADEGTYLAGIPDEEKELKEKIKEFIATGMEGEYTEEEKTLFAKYIYKFIIIKGDNYYTDKGNQSLIDAAIKYYLGIFPKSMSGGAGNFLDNLEVAYRQNRKSEEKEETVFTGKNILYLDGNIGDSAAAYVDDFQTYFKNYTKLNDISYMKGNNFDEKSKQQKKLQSFLTNKIFSILKAKEVEYTRFFIAAQFILFSLRRMYMAVIQANRVKLSARNNHIQEACYEIQTIISALEKSQILEQTSFFSSGKKKKDINELFTYRNEVVLRNTLSLLETREAFKTYKKNNDLELNPLGDYGQVMEVKSDVNTYNQGLVKLERLHAEIQREKDLTERDKKITELKKDTEALKEKRDEINGIPEKYYVYMYTPTPTDPDYGLSQYYYLVERDTNSSSSVPTTPPGESTREKGFFRSVGNTISGVGNTVSGILGMKKKPEGGGRRTRKRSSNSKNKTMKGGKGTQYLYEFHEYPAKIEKVIDEEGNNILKENLKKLLREFITLDTETISKDPIETIAEKVVLSLEVRKYNTQFFFVSKFHTNSSKWRPQYYIDSRVVRDLFSTNTPVDFGKLQGEKSSLFKFLMTRTVAMGFLSYGDNINGKKEKPRHEIKWFDYQPSPLTKVNKYLSYLEIFLGYYVAARAAGTALEAAYEYGPIEKIKEWWSGTTLPDTVASTAADAASTAADAASTAANAANTLNVTSSAVNATTIAANATTIAANATTIAMNASSTNMTDTMSRSLFDPFIDLTQDFWNSLMSSLTIQKATSIASDVIFKKSINMLNNVISKVPGLDYGVLALLVSRNLSAPLYNYWLTTRDQNYLVLHDSLLMTFEGKTELFGDFADETSLTNNLGSQIMKIIENGIERKFNESEKAFTDPNEMYITALGKMIYPHLLKFSKYFSQMFSNLFNVAVPYNTYIIESPLSKKETKLFTDIKSIKVSTAPLDNLINQYDKLTAGTLKESKKAEILKSLETLLKTEPQKYQDHKETYKTFYDEIIRPFTPVPPSTIDPNNLKYKRDLKQAVDNFKKNFDLYEIKTTKKPEEEERNNSPEEEERNNSPEEKERKKELQEAYILQNSDILYNINKLIDIVGGDTKEYMELKGKVEALFKDTKAGIKDNNFLLLDTFELSREDTELTDNLINLNMPLSSLTEAMALFPSNFDQKIYDDLKSYNSNKNKFMEAYRAKKNKTS